MAASNSDSTDNPTSGFRTFEEFAASMPEVSRDQAEAIWDFFRSNKRLSQASKISDNEPRLERGFWKLLTVTAVLWAFAFAFFGSNRGLVVLLSIPAYIASAFALHSYCRQRCSPVDAKLPFDVFVLLIVWALFTIFGSSLLKPETGLISLFYYVESHGWFVVRMVVLGFLLTLIFLDKPDTARSTLNRFVSAPLLPALALFFAHQIGITQTSEFDFLGGVIVCYMSLPLAIFIARGFKERYAQKPDGDMDRR